MDRVGPALTPVAIGLFGLAGLLPAFADSPNELYVYLLAAGSALAALAGSSLVALVGFVVAGAGCAVCAPTILSIAGGAAKSHERATVVGSLTTVMYLGFLVGPAAVGGLAELTTLRASLGSVAALAVLLTILFAIVRFPAPQRG